MEMFPKKFVAKIATWDMSSIDTDMIIPGNMLNGGSKKLGMHLFDGLRFTDNNVIIFKDPEARTKDPNFFLNKAENKDAEILIAGENFGCGSSREHAVWALKDYGFKVIIAPSFADIFYGNAFKNGLLLITADEKVIYDIENQIQLQKLYYCGKDLTVDLVNKQIHTGLTGNIDGDITFHFDIDPLKQKNLLEGLDEINITLEKYSDDIVAFKADQKIKYPWI